ncbi:MAG: hypothetical protein LBS14_03455 [Holosporaceae bacterium]|nr:hypothetical protein [Holosporaceae bacterium]
MTFVGSGFVSLVGVPLGVVYLTNGVVGSGIATAMVSIAAVLMMPLDVAVRFVLAVLLPIGMLSFCAQKNVVKRKKIWWYPESIILQCLVILFLATTAIMSVTIATEESVLQAQKAFCDRIKPQNNPNVIIFRQLMMTIAKYSVGLCQVIALFESVFCFGLANNICRKMGKNVRSSFDLMHLRVNHWLAISPLIALTFSHMLPDKYAFLCSGLAVVGAVAPGMVGFSTVQRVLSGGKFAKISFYASLILLHSLVIPILIIVGIATSFLPENDR